MIIRKSYLERLFTLRDKDIIKVLTGVRRSGKSTILEQYKDKILNDGVNVKNIISYNFEDMATYDIRNFKDLYFEINNKLVNEDKYYIFLDEVQKVEHFEELVDSLFIKKNVDLYITGSNSYMLAGELATLLSGRYIEIRVMPLSFKEYYEYAKIDKKVCFDHYLTYGGFPFTTKIDDERSYKEYLDSIVNTVLIKDVLSRNNRSDTNLVYQLTRYLVDIQGNLVTSKKIADTLTSMGKKTTTDTIINYLNDLTISYLFYKCDRYDITGKKYLSINSKYYPVDQGLKKSLTGSKRPDFGKLLETIVYLELVRRYYEVYVGINGEYEIDFVAIKDGIVEYYQVAYTVVEQETYNREVRSLFNIKDNFRKMLLTLDTGYFNDNGIEQINVIDWLLKE